MRHAYLLAFLSVIMAACAAGGAGGSTTAAGASSHITSEEIARAGLPTAYDLVERLRRPWLRRDAVTGGDVAVYMENRRLGGAEVLRDIPAVDVESLELIDNNQATLRWGNTVKGSVILVKRKY